MKKDFCGFFMQKIREGKEDAAHIPFECFFGDRDSTDEREQSSAIPQKIFVLYLIGKDGLAESMKTKFHNSRWLTGTFSRRLLSRKTIPEKKPFLENTGSRAVWRVVLFKKHRDTSAILGLR